MFDTTIHPPMTAANTTVYVVDPQMRECAKVGGWGTDSTEVAVDNICALVPIFRRAGVKVEFVWSALDETGEIQHPQNLAADAPSFQRLTPHIETSLGGIHPKIKALILPDDAVHKKFTTSALSVPEIRRGVEVRGAGHSILLGFNYSDCVTRFGVELRCDKALPTQAVSILSDASADNNEIAIAEMYNDCGIGESANSMLRRAANVQSVRSDKILSALGIH